MNDSRIDRLAFLELVAHAVPSVVRVAAAFQITRIGWTGAPDFPTLVADAENAQGARLRRLLSSLSPMQTAGAGLPHPQSDFGGAAAKALEGMDREGISRTIVMPPPFSRGSRAKCDFEDFAGATSERVGRLS